MTITLPWTTRVLSERAFKTSLTYAEAAKLAELAEDRTVIEVGTAYAYSTCVMGQKARFVFSVDPHSGHGSLPGSLEESIRAVREMGLEYCVQLVVGHAVNFIPRLRAAGARFDMAFIDGDHRFEAGMTDLRDAWAILKPGGVLAVHDFNEATCPDVRRALEATFDTHTLQEATLTDTLWTITKVAG